MTLVWLGESPDLDPALVGGKARGINTMRAMGLPVPPAFVLSTQMCEAVLHNGGRLTDDILDALRSGLTQLEAETGRGLEDPDQPLLISVRSGAATSMPGMMDTVLNLGINDTIESTIAQRTGDPAFAADTHRRYREQFARVVGDHATGDAWQDLRTAAEAVFRSWQSPRAQAYRRHHGIPDHGGTAVTVQAMVFGNYDDRSGTGVMFTRNPSTGEPGTYGEWLRRGQGEDVVSGRFDAKPLTDLREELPEAYDQLIEAGTTLERWAKDVQDIEFTVEAGRLWLLQTRIAKRSPEAAVRFAVDLCEEGVIERQTALSMVSDQGLRAALRPSIEPRARQRARLLAHGEPASPGIGIGRVVTSCEEAEDLADEGVDVVLARPYTDPEDIGGMMVARAIITEVGGATSHAAVVSRELGTPCIVGCGQDKLADLTGTTVTVDGTTGEVFEGALELADDESAHRRAAMRLTDWAKAGTATLEATP